MKKFKRSSLNLILILFFTGGTLLWINSVEKRDVYTTISKNLTIIGQIYKEVSRRYVDKIDPDKFLKAGIDGMLNTLDPYTSYIEKEDKQQLQILAQGKYEGVGLLLTFRNKVVTVAEPPFLGTPAARAGIREGDKIIKVNGLLTKELGFEGTVSKIRGPAGTEVTLTIQREGEPKLLEFTLIREKIKVEDVRYAGFIKNGIGYVRLTRFSKNAAPEVAEAVQNLKSRNLKGLILDLRSNPGGMLESAVEVADMFLPKNLVIVSIRGRSKNSPHEFKSLKNPIYGDSPLVVLVNQFSASASEIVAGAIQDYDRGIIVGDTTFGKGLVQSVIPLSPTSALKITTAKYYTPSGRCIQKQNYSFWSDSLTVDKKSIYHTRSGRPVHGGGGIAPDVVVRPPMLSDLVVDLIRKSLFFNFAVHYANTHSIIDSTLQIKEDILNDFRQYLKKKSFKYHYPIEKDLSLLKKDVVESGYDSSLVKNIDLFEQSLDRSKNKMFLNSLPEIKRYLRLELASKFFGTRKGVELSLQDDPVVKKAVELLSDKAYYSSIIKVTH